MRMGLHHLAVEQRAQAEGVQLDEALRVLLIVGAAIILEGDEVLRVERIGRGAAGDANRLLRPRSRGGHRGQ